MFAKAPNVTLLRGFTAVFGEISVTEGSGLAREWADESSGASSVLDLSVDQIDVSSAPDKPVLDLGSAMEIVPPASEAAVSADPFVRIREARPRQSLPDKEALPPPVLPRIAHADWSIVLSSSEVALDHALSTALQHATSAKIADDRSRAVLYRAISAAYDLALAVRDAPHHYAALLAARGITALPRAPMTPIVKLVFGTDYDKTRLAEYATVLTHAARHNVGWGQLEELLSATAGGIKAVVALERQGGPAALLGRHDVRPALPSSVAKGLRKLPSLQLDQTCRNGNEFAMVMVRRAPDGKIEVVGEIPSEANLMRKAAKAVLAAQPKAE